MVCILRTALLILLLTAPLSACSQQAEEGGLEQALQTEPLKIITRDGRELFFKVEVADEHQELQQGLMFRKEMAADHGMIFLFNDLRPRGFWMKNTYLPLDILYVGQGGEIVSIKKGEPLSEANILSDYPAQAAIELNYGTARQMNIRAGDKVVFNRLNL